MQQRLFFRSLACFGTVLLLTMSWTGCRFGKAGRPGGKNDGGFIQVSCYYIGDEKYAADQEAIDQAEWFRQFVKDIHGPVDDFSHYNLFSHHGGGPAGAEWNSDGAILVMFSTQLTSDKMDQTGVSLNGESISPRIFKSNTPNGTVVLFQISPDDWMSRLAPIKKSDYSLIYDDETVRNLKNQPGSPIGVGQILKIEVKWDDLSGRKPQSYRMCKAFHHAIGE